MRKNSLRLIVRVSIVIAFFFVPLFAKADATDDQIAVAAKLLADDFRPHVITLDRDIQVFHYFHASWAEADVPLESSYATHELLKAIHYFWAGDGNEALYAAHDPSESRYLGDTLLEITIKSGSHILDGHHDGIRLSAATVAAMNKVNGIDYTPIYVRFDVDLQRMPRSILAPALASLGVEAATYDWVGNANPACEQTSSATFVILGTPIDLSLASQGSDAIAKNMTAIGLTPGASEFMDSKKRDEYYRIERFLSANGNDQLNSHIPKSDLGTITAEERANWREQIFSCDFLHPSDDNH